MPDALLGASHAYPHCFLLQEGPIFQVKEGGAERLSHWFKDTQEESKRRNLNSGQVCLILKVTDIPLGSPELRGLSSPRTGMARVRGGCSACDGGQGRSSDDISQGAVSLPAGRG